MNAKLAEIDFLPYQAKDSYDFSSCGYYTDDTNIAGYGHGRAQKGTSACSLWFNGPVTYGAVNFYYRTNGIKGKNFDQYTIELQVNNLQLTNRMFSRDMCTRHMCHYLNENSN